MKRTFFCLFLTLSSKTVLVAESLHKAIELGDAKLVRKLATRETLKEKGFLGYTPLYAAVAKHFNENVVTVLLEAGADPNSLGMDGQTAPHQAAMTARGTSVARKLIRAGATVDAMDKNWKTPLFYAVMLGNEEGVALLLRHGARTNNEIARIARSRGLTHLFRE